MKVLAELFFAFFKTGLITFGGGYAMLPMLKNELVEKRNWLTSDELIDYFAVGQCTPGIIAVNVATFCGYKLKKDVGAVVATCGLVLPSLLIIMMIASVFEKLEDYPSVRHILSGVRIGLAALLINIVCDLCVKLYRDNKNKILPCVIFVLSAAGLILFHLPAVLIVVLTLCVSIFILIKQGRKK